MSNYDTRNIDRFSAVFGALSNPHRLQIYTLLSGCCGPQSACGSDAMSCCVGELGGQLDIAASTLSHHLKGLSHAGLIHMQRNGKQIICSINGDMLDELRQFFQHNPEVYDESQTGR